MSSQKKKKIKVIGFDINKQRIQKLSYGKDHTNEIDKKELKKTKIFFSYNLTDLKDCNIFIVTVPTPVNNKNKPDLAPLLNATKLVSKVFKKKTLLFMSQLFSWRNGRTLWTSFGKRNRF